MNPHDQMTEDECDDAMATLDQRWRAAAERHGISGYEYQSRLLQLDKENLAFQKFIGPRMPASWSDDDGIDMTALPPEIHADIQRGAHDYGVSEGEYLCSLVAAGDAQEPVNQTIVSRRVIHLIDSMLDYAETAQWDIPLSMVADWTIQAVFEREQDPKGRRPIPQKTRRLVMERDGHQCVRCLSPYRLSMDHITPVAKGGSNHHENLQTLCMPCNMEKGTKTMEEWLGTDWEATLASVISVSIEEEVA